MSFGASQFQRFERPLTHQVLNDVTGDVQTETEFVGLVRGLRADELAASADQYNAQLVATVAP